MAARRGKRRSGIKQTIGLIVEGDAEYHALPRLHTRKLIQNCPPLKAVNLGGVGSHMTPAAIARKVSPRIIEHQVAGRTKVVLCIDREQRERCAPGFAADVRSALEAEFRRLDRTLADVHVVISDRAFEAWLLAGARELHAKGKLKKSPTFYSFEGSLGAGSRKGVVELEALLARPYSKVVDGVALFESLDFAAARTHGGGAHGSRSLDKFLRTLGV